MAFFETLSTKVRHVFRQGVNWLDNGAKIGAAIGAAIGIGFAIAAGGWIAALGFPLLGILGGGFVGLNMGGFLGAAKGLITRSRPNGDQIMKDASQCNHAHQPQLSEQVHMPVNAPAVSSDNGLPIAPDTKVAAGTPQPQGYVNALPPGAAAQLEQVRAGNAQLPRNTAQTPVLAPEQQPWASRVRATPELVGAGRQSR